MTLVEVSGLGAIAGPSQSKEDLFRDCLQSRTGVIAGGTAPVPEELDQKLKSQTPDPLKRSRCTVFSYHAIKAALSEAHWTPEEIARAGFIVSSTTGEIELWEKALPTAKPSELSSETTETILRGQSLGEPLLALREFFGFQGPAATIASSCSASLQALAMGYLWIKQGKVDRCVVGGVDVLCELTQVGFSSLRLLSAQQCRPFDRKRSGINLGEGAGFLCLERAQEKPARWGYVRGVGLSSDAHHATAPHPDGEGSIRALEMALKNAELSPTDIGWIYAHGTASPANDSAESRAIAKCFGHVPVSSTKAIHGHTLAASGCIEAVIGLLAMRENVILPTCNFSERDPEITVQVSNQMVQKSFQHFVKNSLGFGGINVAAIFSRGPQ